MCKRIISVLLVLAMLFCFAGCKKDSDNLSSDISDDIVSAESSESSDNENESDVSSDITDDVSSVEDETESSEVASKPTTSTTSSEETKPSTSKPSTSKPQSSKPQQTKPTTPKPQESKPQSSKPATSTPDLESEASKPVASKPEASKPAESKPDTSKPDGTKPESKPQSSAPQVSKPMNPSPQTPTKPTVDYSKKVPSFTNKDFEISAFWCPYDISVKGLTEYKNAGFNTLFTGNHSLSRTSDNQFYLGSNRTMTALKNAKTVGLDVILNYNDWIAEGIEGKDYYGSTPFSKHDIYGDYKDIIVGVHIVDEPGAKHIEEYGNQTLINDFKKVYPNANYVVNLLPEYALDYRGWGSAEEMYNTYRDGIMNKFENNRMISIDCYFFHKQFAEKRRTGLMKNYDNVAKFAKENNASQTFIMQTAVGNEFVSTLSEGDIRLQANMAMAFGADAMQYYCYSVPIDTSQPDNEMYDYCILNPDNTPSPLYNYVKNVNGECQSLADVILSYNWQEATGIEGKANVASVGEFYEMQEGKFTNTKHYVYAKGVQDIVMSRFTSDKHGEAYMLVNFAQRELNNKVDLQMKNCGALAIYGGKGFNGKPQIVELDTDGKCSIELNYGEGVFIVPLS